jgi:DNA-binding NtrC family response regulator
LESARIAYIDDNKLCLEVIKSAFAELNINVDTFDDPILFYQNSKSYMCVIFDYEMPLLNGHQLVEMAKEKDPLVKTIIYSGYIEHLDQYQKSVDKYLSKPCDFDKLVAVVSYLLQNYDRENRLLTQTQG